MSTAFTLMFHSSYKENKKRKCLSRTIGYQTFTSSLKALQLGLTCYNIKCCKYASHILAGITIYNDLVLLTSLRIFSNTLKYFSSLNRVSKIHWFFVTVAFSTMLHLSRESRNREHLGMSICMYIVTS